MPLLGQIVPFLGIFEPRLGRFKPLLGIRKSLLGITKFVAVLNTRYLGKFLRARNSTSVEVKTIASTKAMVFLHEQSYGSDSNPFENYAKADFTKSFRSSMTSIYAQHSLDLRLSARDRNTCRYSKIAKRIKRRREREPSRLSVRNILRSMKKRKARCKLKIIVRKSTPKSSRLYSLATDYKFWYVRYLNKSCCFFSNFVNVNRVIAKKLLRKSK